MGQEQQQRGTSLTLTGIPLRQFVGFPLSPVICPHTVCSDTHQLVCSFGSYDIRERDSDLYLIPSAESIHP